MTDYLEPLIQRLRTPRGLVIAAVMVAGSALILAAAVVLTKSRDTRSYEDLPLIEIDTTSVPIEREHMP